MALADTVFLPVKDVQKAAQWYHETFGHTIGWHNLRITETFAWLLSTPDATQIYAALKAKGIEVEIRQDQGAIAALVLRDLDGNALNLYLQ
ncbi:MAG: VOC family protein [Anaerolineae bacterium]|jgi:catechol-2,3-dioxygenase|nr:VOC family protein [Anaerolineae bacterium]